MRERDLAEIEASEDAQQRWVAHVGDLASQTLRYTCGSWYLGANVPGKPRVFMPYIGGFPRYVQECRDVAAGGYTGFALR
jgi:cyclohexanone monooxygenase